MTESLVFIDTNIFLEFYKIEGHEKGLSILNRINDNHNLMITSSQVEMEFKKNRQNVIIESYKSYKTPPLDKWKPPVFLLQSRQYQAIMKKQAHAEKYSEDLRDRMKKVLHDPSRYDPVYKVTQRLFRSTKALNLNRKNKKMKNIIEYAEERFISGYPPRKANDTSMGDAIHWEWIIDCANTSGKDIIIVSGDKDYGQNFGGEVILNDWLLQEFRERVSRRRNIKLTMRLTEGLKAAGIIVSKQEEEVEDELIEKRTESMDISTFSPETIESILNPFREELRKTSMSLQGVFKPFKGF